MMSALIYLCKAFPRLFNHYYNLLSLFTAAAAAPPR